MATIDADRIRPYVERLVDNGYVQENLRDAAVSLRAAYARASKRRVEPTRDEKLRRQVREAMSSLNEAVDALRTGRKKPKRRTGRRLLAVVGLAAVGVGVALAASDELRAKVLGGAPEEGAER